jgi:hypothetical protein
MPVMPAMSVLQLLQVDFIVQAKQCVSCRILSNDSEVISQALIVMGYWSHTLTLRHASQLSTLLLRMVIH